MSPMFLFISDPIFVAKICFVLNPTLFSGSLSLDLCCLLLNLCWLELFNAQLVLLSLGLTMWKSRKIQACAGKLYTSMVDFPHLCAVMAQLTVANGHQTPLTQV